MPRYGIKPRFWFFDDGSDWWSEGPQSINVIEAEIVPRPTGILDKNGNELFEIPDKRRIGF